MGLANQRIKAIEKLGQGFWSPWVPLRATWDLLEGSWEALSVLLGASWRLLEASGSLLGISWGGLWLILVSLEWSLAGLEVALVLLGGSLEALGSHLGVS